MKKTESNGAGAGLASLRKLTVGILGSCALLPAAIDAQTVSFNTSSSGQTKAITEWGIEVVQWNSDENARLSKNYMGENEIDILWCFFWPGAALDGSGNLVQEHKDWADSFIDGGAAALLPNAAWGFGPNINDTDPYFFPGGSFSAQRWHDLMAKTTAYYQSRGQTVSYLMPFNEADFWAGQGSPADLGNVAQLLANNPALNGIGLMGASTLSSGNAWNDYTNFGTGGASGPLTHGSTHHLQWYDSATAISDFYTYVRAQGDVAYNPEFHSMGEAIFGAEYGVTGGAFWGAALRARGLFVQACQGDRLGYAENRGGWNADYLTQSAAAVYRAPDGELYGFAGGFERQGDFGGPNNYRFVSTDRDVYFNGVGPMREFMIPVRKEQDAYVDIDYGTKIMPALDGHRWKIVNRLTGEVLEVANAGTGDGANIRTAPDTDGLHQKWNIERTRDGYFALYNANSGKTAEVENWATWNGANVRQWGVADSLLHFWYIDHASDGFFYLRNGNSSIYMDADLGSDNVLQWGLNGGQQQQWQFVLADPVAPGSLTHHYKFDGNTTNSAGSGSGTAVGSPAYTSGHVGQAIDLDGSDDYVDLPNDVANAEDITVAAWVRWDGGAVWQRIFDFGMDNTRYMFLTPSNGGAMRFALTANSNNHEEYLETDPLPVGQWVHVAVTMGGNTAILYVNGAPKVGGMIFLNPNDVFTTGGQNNYIGKSQWPDALFNGAIDDFRIYDYALSGDQIAGLYNGSGDTTPPAAPANLAATAGDGSVSLDWSDSTEPDFASYKVGRSTVSGSNYAQIASGLTTSAFVDSSVTNGTTYYYAVTALDTTGNESVVSNEASATPQSQGGGATTLHVSAITPTTISAGKGSKRGQVQVTIVDNTGAPVSGASVIGTFTGSFNETVAATTNGSGVAVLTTSGTAKGGVTFTCCIQDVSGALPYNAGQNVETCDSF